MLRVGHDRGQPIPYDLFSGERTDLEANRARRMEKIYHTGQVRIWDGRTVLEELIAKHGPPKLSAKDEEALVYLLSVIMWGEYAAWRVAAELADQLATFESRMAATSQSHDEARHFYVLHDYIHALGRSPVEPGTWARRVIEMTLKTDSITSKLLGMQLTIESIALALFKAIRDCGVDPILTELMPYYEQDEARHVGLGHQLLPSAFATIGRRDRFRAQIRQVWMSLSALGELKELEPHLSQLGIAPHDIIFVAKDKMTANLREVELAGSKKEGPDFTNGVIEVLIEGMFPFRAKSSGLVDRVSAIGSALKEGIKPLEERGPLGR